MMRGLFLLALVAPIGAEVAAKDDEMKKYEEMVEVDPMVYAMTDIVDRNIERYTEGQYHKFKIAMDQNFADARSKVRMATNAIDAAAEEGSNAALVELATHPDDEQRLLAPEQVPGMTKILADHVLSYPPVRDTAGLTVDELYERVHNARQPLENLDAVYGLNLAGKNTEKPSKNWTPALRGSKKGSE